jgi:hypothetical protein
MYGKSLKNVKLRDIWEKFENCGNAQNEQIRCYRKLLSSIFTGSYYPVFFTGSYSTRYHFRRFLATIRFRRFLATIHFRKFLSTIALPQVFIHDSTSAGFYPRYFFRRFLSTIHHFLKLFYVIKNIMWKNVLKYVELLKCMKKS